MLDTKFFASLEKNQKQYQDKRHQLIKNSADILRKSKQTIFAVHQDNLKKAQTLLKETEEILKNLTTAEFQKNTRLRHEGSFRAALEEFIEAKLFFDYIFLKKFTPFEIIEPEFDEWLGGICDFTGEIVRKSILAVTQGKTDLVSEYTQIVSLIIENLIKLDITGKTRIKFDDAKRNLKRLEEILYDLKIRK
jgi:translin